MSEAEIKAIPTRYKGYHFRSRLEARWAVFFDSLLLNWEYEPEGFQLSDGYKYLPDFKVKYPGRSSNENHYVWFEVKNDIDSVTVDDWAKLKAFNDSIPYVVHEYSAPYLGAYEHFILLDGPPTMRCYFSPTDWLCGRPQDPYKRISKSGVELKINPQYHIGVVLWSNKGRLWFDDYDTYFGEPDWNGYSKLLEAVDAARSARFEYGEYGRT